MKKIKIPKSLVVLLVAPALLALVLPAGRLLAQSQTETKIRLMADALRSRDSGDLDAAKKNLEELLALAPNDATVQRLLNGVNAAIAARANGAPVAEAAPAAVSAPAASEPIEVSLPKPGDSKVAQTPVDEATLQADALVKQEDQRIKDLVSAARTKRSEARSLAKDGRFDDAAATLDGAIKSLPSNPATKDVIADLEAEKNGLLLEKAQYLLKQGDTEGARTALEAYAQASPDSKKVQKVSKSIDRVELNPPMQPIEKVSPKFITDQKEIAKLAAKGRSQYLASDVDGAQETFRLVESIDPSNPEAKSFLTRIAREKSAIGTLNREKTHAQLIEEVANSWQRPGVYIDRGGKDVVTGPSTPLAQKLNSIQIPSVNFNGVELSKVVSTLTAISEEYDKSEGAKGVNIVLIDPSNKNPSVSITLRNLSLKRILDFITDATGYQYEVQADAIVVRPGGETSSLDTAFFPVTRSTVIRMTGVSGAAASATPAAAADPFAPAAAAPAGGGGATGGEAQSLRAFLQQAGVDFDGTPKSSLAYDGAAIIVTQTTRNIERIRNILNRYNDVRQVEIEAKFMDVQEGALDELGVNWQAARTTGASTQNYTTANRSLAGALTNSSTSASGLISQQSDSGIITPTPITDNAPSIPGGAYLANGTSTSGSFLNATNDLAVITGLIGGFDVKATIRALSQKSGSDLLSAPKVTVLSGNPANIVIAQEMRYPQSYGEVQSQVGTGANGGGAAGVTITAGTPQEFTMRNVGVELKVTPTVEEDDYSISLDLNPKVTEFEGFVEYGGTSVAISGNTTVTVPSGFFQPIFSTREVTTKVTVWDGATLVMGGLTREEIKKTSDKVPILGDIPFIGRAFRSKGETSQKRNLLIFVTANLVSPGGSPKKQQLKSVAPSSMFQNPTIVTPGSAESRVRTK
ncbi:MAG: type II secretory pathway, component PulD [Verrucomicrobia bacterium]|nr:type II secretory pathway, component PulD [Verrucomicrobiota bacterium]